MPDQSWQKTASRNTSETPFAIIMKIVTLGIAANPEPWEVTYTDQATGAIVRATGATEADADARARSRFLTVGTGSETSH
jgi:hypothetical protein